jgi:YegS/Rv2252/BmrU family lipid kinase
MIPYRKVLIIINPQAGQKNPSKIRARIEAFFERENAEFTIRETTQAGDTVQWSRSASAEGYDLVTVAGGDGTVLEAVEGLMRSGARIPLAQIPTGTVNVTARSLSIPTALQDALNTIASGRTVRIDLGYLPEQDRYFVFVCGAGNDARLIQDTTREMKKKLGFFAYVASGVRHFFSVRPVQVELEIDDFVHRMKAHTVMVINIGTIANLGISFGPNIDPHDGRLNVMILSSRSLWGTLLVLMRILTKRYHGFSALRHTQAQRVRISASTELPVQIDGEPLDTTPFLAEVIPNAVSLVVPNDYVTQKRAPIKPSRFVRL